MSDGERLAGITRDDGGAAIGYEIGGLEHSGTPVLLIRPLGGTMALWGRFREQLEQQFRVIAFDLPGTGRSGQARRWVSTRSLSRDALRVLDELDVGLAHVFGLSLGGMIATWLGILAPTRVARLCIASTPARGLDLGGAGLRRELRLAACLARREVEVCLVHRVLSREFRAQQPEAVRKIEAIVRRDPASRVELLRLAAAGVSHDARAELRRIRATTLVLAGAHDGLVQPEHPRALARAIRDSRFELVPNSGHDLTLEQPQDTATRVARSLLA